MHHSHSRRKQNRPNRATVTSSTSSPSAATAFPRNLSEDDFEVSSSTPQLFDSSPLPSGTTLGPFPVRPATLEDSPKFIFKVHDFAQQTFAFTLLGPEAQLLKRISAAPTPSEANAAVTPVSADGRQLGLQVLVTKPAALSDLRAIYIEKPSVPKKFPCGLCNKALFSTMENLKNHQQSYCQPAQPTVIASSQFPNLLTHFMRPPNLPILLPVAFHNHENPALVQLIGNPQIFLPVAVHPRPVQFSSTPLVLDRDMCQNLQVPQSLTLGNNEALNLEIVVAGTNGVIATEEKPAPEAEIVEPNPKRPKQEEPSAESDPLPLDLSRKSSRPNSSAANSVASQNKAPSPMKIRAPVAVKSKPVDSKAAAASTEKPFVCDCGVAFTNKEILLGHRKFYCKNGPGANEPPREPLRKSVSYACPRQACTFEGSSNTQLQTHIRQIHNNIRGYMCKFCGYRGQSLRGMRSHLKDHEHLSSESQNENEFILEITKETNTFVCPQCKLEIPTIFQLKHKCPERERTDS
ncbi:hypothetical protein L596_007490 [Steinernema carpocapsae]|uniref:C2H2-type domain-containing protein n=1 Tax=Steinernema carpocapsae TaxID=34508 RepID=A0A4U5P9J0_STECR|nr:hypothetical protein L596_007490 [Steinernema carpocapsae]